MKTGRGSDVCNKYQQQVWDYFEMKPHDPLREEIDNHMKACESCRVLFNRTAAVNQYLNFQKGLSDSIDVSTQVLERYHKKRKKVIPLTNTVRSLAAAAIIILMVTSGIIFGQFIAGRMIHEQASNVADPVSSVADETFFADADYFIPGYEFLNE